MLDGFQCTAIVSCNSCGEEPDHDLQDSVLTRIECKTPWCRNFKNEILGSKAQVRFDEELDWFNEELKNGYPSLKLLSVEPGDPYTVFDPNSGKPVWEYTISFELEPISF